MDNLERSISSDGHFEGRINFGYRDSPLPLSAVNLCRLEAFDDEPTPKIDHYRNTITTPKRQHRPALRELHRERTREVDVEDLKRDSPDTEAVPDKSASRPKKPVKFGWIVGVYIRCVLNILGAMLYLRLSWVVGQAGIGLATVIILLSAVVTTLTALSMCTICTNGEIRGGGAYYMLSRALGPEFGGSMGLLFALANALGVGLHVVGFAETVTEFLKKNDTAIVDGALNDVRIVGVCTLIVCFCIVLMGVDFEAKAQMVLVAVLSVSYINYAVGTFIPPSLWKRARGVTGYSWDTFRVNFFPAWRNEGFFSVFAVYFPAGTGIMAGANISGDLKDPGKAIPKGTLLAILTTTLIYLGGAWMSGSAAMRDASGDIDDLFNGTLIICTKNGTAVPCRYGILNYFQTMEMQSAFGPLITAGIFAATLSSALACLVSGPKLLQAVGRDKLFPKLDWFARGYGKQDEPRRACVLGFFVSLGMICVGDLNVIAAYISNFYLATYGLINYACFDCSVAQSPGWRPGFKYYNKWSSLLGAALCLACMFLVSWVAALFTFVFVIALYIYLLRKQPDVNWGSSTQAHNYRAALKGVRKLLYTEEHVKNYRPQILALTGNPVARPSMVDFVRCITGGTSLLMFGHVVMRKPTREYYESLQLWTGDLYAWLRGRKAKGFYNPVACSSLREGVQYLLQACGVGKLKPNIVVMGFKNDWAKCANDRVEDYFQILHEAFECGVGVGVLRVHGGLDYSEETLENALGGEPKSVAVDWSEERPVLYSTRFFVEEAESCCCSSEYSIVVDEKSTSSVSIVEPVILRNVPAFNRSTSAADGYKPRTPHLGYFSDFRIRSLAQIPKDALAKVNRFGPKIKNPVIDIWWLSDDGGLTLLIPYLLTRRSSYLANAKLRVFTSASNGVPIHQEEKSFYGLLKKFRIKASDVRVITDVDRLPRSETTEDFDRTIEPLKATAKGKRRSDPSRPFVTEEELNTFKSRTNFYLRIRELLLQHSKSASLVVITLPVPRKGGVSAGLYLAWLDMLSKDISPMLFVRGNHRSVLTVYS